MACTNKAGLIAPLDQAHLDWDAVRALLQSRHEQLMQFLSVRSEADLYGGRMRGANNKWVHRP